MRHQDKVGHWVVVDGVRNSYRGKLLEVQEYGADAVLMMHPLYALESLADTNNEVEITTSEEHPGELYAAGILTLTLQPKAWSKG